MPTRLIRTTKHAPFVTRYAVLVRFYATEIAEAVSPQTDPIGVQLGRSRIDAVAFLLFPTQWEVGGRDDFDEVLVIERLFVGELLRVVERIDVVVRPDAGRGRCEGTQLVLW